MADIAVLLDQLVEAARQGGGKADWGHDAFYLCEAGELTQREFLEPMAEVAVRMKLIASRELKSITRQRANEIVPLAGIIMGSSSRGQSIRARKRLRWEPKGRSWEEELDGLLGDMAKEMGLL